MLNITTVKNVISALYFPEDLRLEAIMLLPVFMVQQKVNPENKIYGFLLGAVNYWNIARIVAEIIKTNVAKALNIIKKRNPGGHTDSFEKFTTPRSKGDSHE